MPSERKEAAALTRKMFLNEAQIAGGLDHPNILRVLDAGEHEGEPYIVMEHVGRKPDAQRLLPPRQSTSRKDGRGGHFQVRESLGLRAPQGRHALRHQAIEHHADAREGRKDR